VCIDSYGGLSSILALGRSELVFILAIRDGQLTYLSVDTDLQLEIAYRFSNYMLIAGSMHCPACRTCLRGYWLRP